MLLMRNKKNYHKILPLIYSSAPVFIFFTQTIVGKEITHSPIFKAHEVSLFRTLDGQK